MRGKWSNQDPSRWIPRRAHRAPLGQRGALGPQEVNRAYNRKASTSQHPVGASAVTAQSRHSHRHSMAQSRHSHSHSTVSTRSAEHLVARITRRVRGEKAKRAERAERAEKGRKRRKEWSKMPGRYCDGAAPQHDREGTAECAQQQNRYGTVLRYRHSAATEPMQCGNRTW